MEKFGENEGAFLKDAERVLDEKMRELKIAWMESVMKDAISDPNLSEEDRDQMAKNHAQIREMIKTGKPSKPRPRNHNQQSKEE